MLTRCLSNCNCFLSTQLQLFYPSSKIYYNLHYLFSIRFNAWSADEDYRDPCDYKFESLWLMEGFRSNCIDGLRLEMSRNQSMEENEWEVLSTPGSIPLEDEEEEEKCCSVGFWIDPGSLIKANYFALSRCNSQDFKAVEGEDSPEYVVDDGFRVRNSSLVLDLLVPPFCREDELGGNCFVAAGHIKSDDMTEGLLCIRDGSGGKSEAGEEFSSVEEEEREEFSRQSDQLEVEEVQSWKPVEVEEEEEGGYAGLEIPQSQRCSITVGKKSKAAGWKHPLGVWKRQVSTLCSLGMAAALMGLFILGRRWCRGKNKNDNQSQRLRFQIFADNQRISHMMCQAARLNQAFSAMRGGGGGGGGVPIVRAQISFGACYYDGL